MFGKTCNQFGAPNLRQHNIHNKFPTSAPISAQRLSHERELFSFTTGRWLANEDRHLSRSYVKFNVPALQEAGSCAMDSPCSGIEKLSEGGHNKIYLLKFENGTDAIARVPYSSVGCPHSLVASEVATMTYLREKFCLPIPKVYAWSSETAHNEVGVEYIIMERLPGVPLDPAMASRELGDSIYEGVLAMQAQLASVCFSQIGSLFFKDDVEPSLQARRLYARGSPDDQWSERFRIGPSVNAAFRREGNLLDETDSGPWTSIEDYIHAIIRSEQRMVQSNRWELGYGLPPSDYSPSRHLKALAQFSSLVPYMVPPTDFRRFCLWHPDLHAANVLVYTEDPVLISGIIDWQGAIIAPLWWQVEMPPCFEYNGTFIPLPERGGTPHRPEHVKLDEISAIAKTDWQLDLMRAVRHSTYESRLSNVPCISEVYDHRLRPLLTDPLSIATSSTWDNVSRCRQAIVMVCVQWEDYLAGLPGYPAEPPLTHEMEELLSYVPLIEEWRVARRLQAHVEEQLAVGLDGFAPVEDYDRNAALSKRLLLETLAAEEDDEDRARMIRWWPYQNL